MIYVQNVSAIPNHMDQLFMWANFFIDFDSTVLNRLRYFVIDIQVEVSFWLIQVRKTTENKKSVRRELTFPWNISNAKFILYAEGISFV